MKSAWNALALLLVLGAAGAQNQAASDPLCQSDTSFSHGPYGYYTNPWGQAKAQGRGGWTTCLQTRTVGAERQTGWRWNWPGHEASVYAYPEITYGQSPFNGGPSSDPRFPMRLSGMPAVSMRFDVQHQASGHWDLAFDVWLTRVGGAAARQPQSIVTEVMIWQDYDPAARPAGDKVADVDVDGVPYALYRATITDQGRSWTYLVYQGPPGRFQGVIRLDHFLADALRRGYTSDQNFLAAIDLGDEVSGGAGSTWLRRYAVTVGAP